VESRERFVQNPRVVLAFIDGRRLSVQQEHVVDSGLRGSNGVFDCEHHVFRQFAILPNEGKVLRPFRYDLRSISRVTV